MTRVALLLSILVVNFIVFDGAHATPVRGSVVISVKNGPFAGEYKLDPSYASCMHSKTRANYSMGFKNFDAQGPKVLAEGGMQLDHDRPGTKTGSLTVSFGEPAKSHTTYEISGAATLVVNGSRVTMSVQGTTESKINIMMNVECGEQLEVP